MGRFIDQALRGVMRSLQLAGTTSKPESTISFHFDAGRSQPEGGGREIPGEHVKVSAEKAAAATSEPGKPNCTAEQLRSCAKALGGLASLEGLGDFLADSLEKGVATPTPETTHGLG